MRTSPMTFHESYGNLPTDLLRKIKAFNVSPADYDMLVDRYGDDYSTIMEQIIHHSRFGTFNWWEWSRS